MSEWGKIDRAALDRWLTTPPEDDDEPTQECGACNGIGGYADELLGWQECEACDGDGYVNAPHRDDCKCERCAPELYEGAGKSCCNDCNEPLSDGEVGTCNACQQYATGYEEYAKQDASPGYNSMGALDQGHDDSDRQEPEIIIEPFQEKPEHFHENGDRGTAEYYRDAIEWSRTHCVVCGCRHDTDTGPCPNCGDGEDENGER